MIPSNPQEKLWFVWSYASWWMPSWSESFPQCGESHWSLLVSSCSRYIRWIRVQKRIIQNKARILRAMPSCRRPSGPKFGSAKTLDHSGVRYVSAFNGGSWKPRCVGRFATEYRFDGSTLGFPRLINIFISSAARETKAYHGAPYILYIESNTSG